MSAARSGGLVVARFLPQPITRKGLVAGRRMTWPFFQTHFSDPRNVALLIRAFRHQGQPWRAIFVWENGAVRGDASYLEFPFRFRLDT